MKLYLEYEKFLDKVMYISFKFKKSTKIFFKCYG